ncbi:hypothetical protein Tco_1425051, partial [Tanacetum coccineum]
MNRNPRQINNDLIGNSAIWRGTKRKVYCGADTWSADAREFSTHLRNWEENFSTLKWGLRLGSGTATPNGVASAFNSDT